MARPPDRSTRHGLGWAAAATLTLHLGLFLPGSTGGFRAAGGAPAATPHAAVSRVRWIQEGVEAAPPPVATLGAVDTRPVVPHAVTPLDPVAPAMPEPPTAPKAPTAPNASNTELDIGQRVDIGDGDFADDEYLPRRLLTVPPRPADTVLLGYPDGAPLGRWEMVLTLFIDEGGRVRHVRPDGVGDVPAALLDHAVQAFLGTAYRPGELGGQLVKSRIQVAVEFRADEPPSSAGLD